MYSKLNSSAKLIGVMLCLLGVFRLSQADAWHEPRGSEVCKNYRPMTEAQLGLAELLFKKMLQGTQITDEWLTSEWARLGYEVLVVTVSGVGWLGLREAESPCRGQGVYLVNRNIRGPLVVQAPHVYHDLYTGEIAAGLLRDGIAVLARNSANRLIRKGSEKVAADLAKRPDSLFVALTRALIETYRKGRLVQIHGFDNKRRRTQAGASAAVILSSGSRWVTPSVESIARCLKPIINGPVLIYPREVTELGATRNLHGRIFRRHGHEGFVHVELNRPTRERLRSDPALLIEFSECLSYGISE